MANKAASAARTAATPPNTLCRTAWRQLRVLGYANYLLVWGSIHRLGFAWRDLDPCPVVPVRAGPRRGRAAGRAGDIRAFPADMADHNTSPPSIALLAFAAAQVVLAAEPTAISLLA